MLNVEFNAQHSAFNIEHSTFNIQHLLFALVFCLFSASAFANDLSLDRRTIRLDEPLTIIVSLEDAFATVDMINVPVKNLTLDSAPSVSSEYSWINGSVVRRKTFRFTAHAIQPGAALVGPLQVIGDDGRRETLAPVSVQVVPDEAAQSNDPLTILRELTATNREPFFVTAEADKTTAIAGEEIIVTWYLYNAATVQRWQITRVPKLSDFWTEEIDLHNEPPSQVLVGTMPMEKVPLRRVALFPLHSGTLTVGGMEVSAEILRRDEDSPFSMFEGSLVEARFPSASMTVDVRPLPAGAASDIVGELTLECGVPQQRAGGPVTFTATLRGRANLRTAPAPKFGGAIAGDVEVQPLALNVERVHDGVVMTRRWSYIVFPSASGTMTLPPLTTQVFNPQLSRREELRCARATIEVQQASAAPTAPFRSQVAGRGSQVWLPWILGIVGALLVIAMFVRPMRRAIEVRRTVRSILNSGNVRDAVHQLVDPNTIANEPSDRGDAYRALRSLLDAIERDRALEMNAADDVERRVRDLVQSLR
jgi:hypothetical protein